MKTRHYRSALASPRGLAAIALVGAGLAIANHMLARRAESRHQDLGTFIEADGVRLRYLARGEGPPVVLLHGNGTMIEDWLASGVFDELAATNRVIAIDRPGFGFSERSHTSIWTPQRQAATIAAALRKLNVEQATVVGHSFGTLVALALALDHPQAVSRLVLISGYYYPTARLDAAIFSPPALPVIGTVLRHTLSPWISRLLAPLVSRRVFAPAPVPATWTEHFPMEMVHRPGQIRALGGDSGLMIPSAAALSKRYGEVSVPVTIITGDGDRIANPERQSERLHAHLAGSRLITLPGIGHMAHYLAPDQISAAVHQTPD